MKNVTYLLGAGASCNSLPLVSNWNERMDNYVENFLKKILEPNYWDIRYRSGILKKYKYLIDNARSQSTMDTYAKKLYLKGDKENLWFLKNLISGFFQFEQIDLSKVKSRNNISSSTDFNPSIPKKESLLDKRYDAFFAALLNREQDELKLPQNLKIISWNYDSQLEIGYKEFSDFSLSESRKSLKIFPSSGYFYKDREDTKEPHIVKLNGTADLAFKNAKHQSAEFLISSSNSEYENIQFKEVYMYIQQAEDRLKEQSQEISYNLHFSWEYQENEISKYAIEKAKKIINNTNILVVIGYSFPVFNRKIDKLILENNNLEKIYIQVPSKDYEGYKSRIKGLTEFKDDKFYPVPELEQFYIPFEL